MTTPSYVLDTNIFIEAARRYYAFDIAKGFWTGLIQCSGDGRITSIDRVAEELARGKDELCTWSEEQFDGGFSSTDDTITITNYRTVISWVQSQPQFFDHAKAKFATGADGWVIAFAKTKNAIVVTEEVYNKDVKKTVPIPNVCLALDLEYINTFELMRRLGLKLGLEN